MENRDEKGLFQKGHNGLRKKGTLNKKTVQIKERIELVLEILDESIEADILALKPREKVQLWMDLQEFIRPKLQRTQTDLTSKRQDLTKIIFEVVNGSKPETESK